MHAAPVETGIELGGEGLTHASAWPLLVKSCSFRSAKTRLRTGTLL